MSTTNNDRHGHIKPVVLGEDDAAAYLSVSASYLRASRLTPPRTSGPPYVRIGRAIRYLRSDLDQWLASKRVEIRA